MKRDLKGVRKLARRYLGEFRQRGRLNNPNRWDQETERRPAQLKCDYCQMEGAGTGVRVGEGGWCQITWTLQSTALTLAFSLGEMESLRTLSRSMI